MCNLSQVNSVFVFTVFSFKIYLNIILARKIFLLYFYIFTYFVEKEL